jgi:hypothetical protein
MREMSELKPWFRDDLARVLLGVNTASRTAQPGNLEDIPYRHGFVTALVSVALVLGIKPERVLLPDDVVKADPILQSKTRS